MTDFDRFNLRTILTSSALTIAALSVFLVLVVTGNGVALTGTCLNYSVTSSGPPASANWTNTSGFWNPPNNSSYPGRDTSCDTAADTNSSATTIIVDSTIPNPITGLNLACSVPGCMIDIRSGGSLALAGTGTIGTGATLRVSGGTLTIASGGTLTFQSGSQFQFDSGSVDIQTGGTIDFPTGSNGVTTGGVISGAGTLSITGGTLNIGSVTSPGIFVMTAGTLNGPGFLSVGKTMTWSGGTITGSGGTELAGGGTGTFDGAAGDMKLDNRAFNDYGSINYSAPPTSGQLYLANPGAQFTVYGLFDITNDGSIENGIATSQFLIKPNGVLQKTLTNGVSTIFANVVNDSTVDVYKGTLEFKGNGTHNGNFFVLQNATMRFSATLTTINGFLGGSGTVDFSAGTTILNGLYSLDGLTKIGANVTFNADGYGDGGFADTTDFTFTAGTLTLAKGLSLYGTGTWSGGTLSASCGCKQLFIDSAATLTINPSLVAATIDAAEILNDGTITYSATVFGSLALANGADIDNQGTFDIASDRPITTGGSSGIVGSGSQATSPITPQTRRLKARTLGLKFGFGYHTTPLSSGSTFVGTIFNNGTLKKSVGTSTQIDPDLDNSDTVLALAGTMSFTGVYTQDSGATTLGPGSIAVTSPLALDGGDLNGTGTLTGSLNNSGGDVAPAGSSSTGTITVTGNYTQGASAKLDIEIATSSYDVLAVGGTPVSLNGTLKVTLLGGYQPANNATFTPLTFTPPPSGDFSTPDFPTWASGHGSFVKSYVTGTGLVLTAVVTPQSADLDASSLSGPANVNAGAPLSYTISVRQNGPDPVSGTITVVNTLPTGVTSASGSGSGGWSCGGVVSGTITCTMAGPVPVSTLPMLTFSMTAPVNGGVITDSVTVSSATNDPSPSNNSKSVNTTVAAQANLSITKTGQSGVVAGQNIVYTIVVTNNGPSTATGVQVSDPTPANLTFVSNSGACTTPYPCNLGTLTSGQSLTITSVYSTSPSFSGSVTNTATVSAATADPDSSNNSIGFTTNVGAQADLSVTKTGPSSTNPGQNITYTVVVTNNGPSPATSTAVSDPTPVGIAFISNSGACTTSYPCSIGTLAAGQSVTITSTYSVPPSYSGGAIVNTASASSAVNDPASSNNSASATTTVGASADVAISNSGPASASPGTNLTYTITVSNFGPAGATGVVVSDPTPSGLTFVSASGGGCSSFPCTIGALAVGPPVTITAIYNLPANYAGASPITNTASVTSASDPNSSNNASTVSTTVAAQADLGITKSGPASVVAGSNISYTITVTNSGTLGAANTFVSDPTPAGLTAVSVSGGGCNAFPCALGTLASGGTVTITAAYNVPSNYSGSSISNTATASTSSPESNTSNNSSTAVTTIAAGGTADLQVSKTGPGQANSGGFADFSITVTNNGPSAATNAVIADPIPAGFSFVSVSGVCSAFPCAAGTLAPGASVSVTSRYRVYAPSGSTVTNTATVSSSVADPVTANNSSSASVTILPSVCPQAPNPLAPLAGSTVSSPVTFSWSRVQDANSYVVTINTSTTTLKIPTASTSVTQLLSNGDYNWSVLVVVSPSSGCEPVSTPSIPFTVCNSVGKTVPNVVSATTTGQTYSVEWAPVDGAVSYELQEGFDAALSSPATTTLAGSSQSFTKNVIAPTPFFYRVRAIGQCSQNPGPYSDTATIVVLPVPPLGTANINIPVPSGSKTPVTFPIHVDGLTGVTTSFFATVDKPWLAVTPTTGIMPPEGVTFNISADPSALSDGTWTGTVIIVFGSSGVSGKNGLDVAPKTSIPVSISLTSPVSPGTLTAPASTAVIIPLVGHLAGLSSQWQSDIRIANITALSKKVQLSFSAGSATSQAVKQTTLNIDAGATTALDDIVRNWFGVGAMSDSSNGVLTVQPLDPAGKPDVSVTKSTVASSRTFNASALGTLGQFIPAVPLANFISKAPGASSILALQQIAQSDTFRTNLGLVEATGKPASVLVSVFNGAGSRILDLPVNIAGGEQVQLNSFLADKGISLTNGHIEVQYTGGDGKVTAYASVIDSRTTDPLLVSGVPLGGTGATRFVIPGVASLDTAAPWRSDVRIFNGSLTPQTTTLTLFPTGNPTASVSNDVTIQPGEVKALDDIVHSTFNLTNTGGALHVTTAVSVPLIVTARTYDQTSTGTLGQFVQAVTPADAVGSGDRSLQLLQMEDSPRYRTNLGIAEVTGKSVTAEVTVILPDSKVAPKVQIPLGAFEYRQFAIISSLGLGNTYNARISVRVIDGQGKITAYGSVIDQKTQDPTFVPAQ